MFRDDAFISVKNAPYSSDHTAAIGDDPSKPINGQSHGDISVTHWLP